MNFDIAIVGAGIVGASCALRLSEEGYTVAIIDANEIASGTTAAGMGHIVVMDDSEAQFALTNYSQSLWSNLAGELPKSSEYETCGTIWVAADDHEMEEVRRKRDFYESRGVKAETLDERSLREAEPELRRGLAGGLLIPNDCVVYQLCATAYFIEKSVRNGATLLTGERVVGVDEGGVKLASGERISAGRIINAAGYWASELTDGLKLVRRKGHLVITERYPNFIRHQLIELGYLKSAHSDDRDSVAFNVQPRMTEQVLIGSSRQYGALNNAIEYDILSQMINRSFEYMPGLKDLSAIRVWAGFRPATPDNLPYIGQCPGFENLFLAVGHEGLGITTSLGTAEILTDELLGRESKIDRKPYSPSRFEEI